MSFLNSIVSAPTQPQNSQDAIVSGGGIRLNSFTTFFQFNRYHYLVWWSFC